MLTSVAALAVPLDAQVPARSALCEAGEEWIAELRRDLRTTFDVDFALYAADTGDLAVPGQGRFREEIVAPELIRAAAGGCPQFLFDEAGILILAIPVPRHREVVVLAVAAFQYQAGSPESNRAARSRILQDVDPLSAPFGNGCWTPQALERLSQVWLDKRRAESQSQRAAREVEKITENLASTYEEISLLHGLTQNLRISNSDDETGQFALRRLADCLPAEGLAILFHEVAAPGETTYEARTQRRLLCEGICPLEIDELVALLGDLALRPNHGPYVANSDVTGTGSWPFPAVRQLIAVPMVEGQNLLGWILAFNHVRGQEFNTVEASLLASVAVILGIHSGNRELYRQQAEFLASVVRALTSAIDAKDPYTCGHSDRVGRIAVRLARELDCDSELVHTIYMAGLLHDIGKIGIDENVLRKPGRLTEAEYEHIKLHPELGFRILADIKQLRNVLPAVLHHHEQWDGKGYPHGLAGERIPWIARIMAVADAYDAMSSSRPYRDGMPAEKVDEIIREGAGKHWDARVVDAFFHARDAIREIDNISRANLTLDVERWTD